MEQQPSKLTPLGRLISLVLVIGLVALGAYLVSDRFFKGGPGGASSGSAKSGDRDRLLFRQRAHIVASSAGGLLGLICKLPGRLLALLD